MPPSFITLKTKGSGCPVILSLHHIESVVTDPDGGSLVFTTGSSDERYSVEETVEQISPRLHQAGLLA